LSHILAQFSVETRGCDSLSHDYVYVIKLIFLQVGNQNWKNFSCWKTFKVSMSRHFSTSQQLNT